ncbi:MAG: hypothetical protein MJ135_06970 [Oscillospiraceae bacterium]|nr:hypothetical protein [Oscillospiraceae bacterium]
MAYVIYNPNPKQARVGDCVVRAICKAIDESWDNVFKGLSAEAYALADMPNANHVWGSFLRKHGFTRTALPDTCPDCYTVAEFAKEHNMGVYILALPTHVVTVKSGDYYDTWDSGDEIVLYYWTRKEATNGI